MADAQVITSSNGTAIGLHLIEWKKGPSASLTPAEAEALVAKLNAGIAWCRAHELGQEPPRSPALVLADEAVARVKAENKPRRAAPPPAVDPDEEFA